MSSVFIVHCKDNVPCRAKLDEGLWTNVAWDQETAENDRKRLDEPENSEGAKFLKKNDPKAFSKWVEKVKPVKCGPHRVVEYLAVE